MTDAEFAALQAEVGEGAKQEEPFSGGWRYQPVFRDDPLVGRTFSLVEMYFDNDDKLEDWTEKGVTPEGEDMEELMTDFRHMIVDAMKWVPMPFDSLRVGMTFERTGANKADVEKLAAAMMAVMPRDR